MQFHRNRVTGITAHAALANVCVCWCRLAKKEEKERKKRQKLGWDEEHIAYTASDNPFGDPHLLSKFVWKKVGSLVRVADSIGVSSVSVTGGVIIESAKLVEIN